jgi:hypothetical protein
MKKHFLLILVVLITTVVFGQRKIKKVRIDEIGKDINLKVDNINTVNNINGLEVTINMVDPIDLNEFFASQVYIDGRFNYSYRDKSVSEYFLKKRKKRKNRSYLEYFNEGLDWLLENEIITEDISDTLYRQILFLLEEDEANLVYNLSGNSRFNPYHISNSYLTVFNVSVTNNTNDIIKLPGDFMIRVNNQSGYVLTDNYILNQLKQIGALNLYKPKMVERFNFKKEELIPANSTISKYISFFPLEYQGNQIDILHTSSKAIFSWESHYDVIDIDNTHNYYALPLALYYSGHKSDDGTFFMYSSNPDLKSVEYEIYADKENLARPTDVFILSFYDEYLYYGWLKGIEIKEYLNFDKVKRYPLKIDLMKISELKRRKSAWVK